MSIWLNDEDQESHLPPRASRVVLPNGFATAAELWIGGAHTAFGDDLQIDSLRQAWLIDCANEFPARYREAASLSLFRVFTDTEEAPPNWARIDALASSLARCLLGESPEGESWDHPSLPPARVYVVCKQGLNRSGLVTARILRFLGLPADDAIAAVRSARPGALNNQAFERLVRE